VYPHPPIPTPPTDPAAHSPGRAWFSVSRNVWFLGLTSLLTDVSSEMVTAILPVYLVTYLGLNPLAFGAVDGIQQGVSALVRWAAGVTGDRRGRHKEVAAFGYVLAAVVKPLWLMGGATWTTLALLVGADRIGKGIRTAPRDALISLSTPPHALATAFGVHRSLDAAGAMLGPLAAFYLLSGYPNRFDLIFILSFAAAMLGLAALLLGVRPPRLGQEPIDRSAARTWADALRVANEPAFRPLLVVGSLLALVTISDPFLYLILLQQQGFDAARLPLLYVITSGVYLLLAAPVGHLADRVGRHRVFFAGYAALLAAYTMLLTAAANPAMFLVVPLLLGLYYAATDGVLQAMASTRLAPHVRGSGLAALGTAISIGRLLASLMMGWLWLQLGYQSAVASLAVALTLMATAAAVVLTRTPRAPGSTP
jgi:MFS family permease